MKRFFLAILAMPFYATAFAGGLMTNTNYHTAFDRMMARGASTEVDAAYSNPAGMVWGHEGWQLSFNWQIPTQNRDITTYVPSYLGGKNYSHKFKGEASAPFVPGLFATYRHQRWAVGAMMGIVGSGGYVRYDEGLPMLTIPVTQKLYSLGGFLKPDDHYRLDSEMKGKQYIYGLQVSGAYQLTSWLSASAGLRVNYYDGYYRGHILTTAFKDLPLIGMELDCEQSGWGVTPIVGIQLRRGPVTLAARYEFRTKLNIPNDTETLSTKVLGIPLSPAVRRVLLDEKMNQTLAGFEDGAKNRYDMPALLSVALGCEIVPQVRATLEYHFFDDTNAHFTGDRQKGIKHGTNEFLVGMEWDINKTFTVSAGGQRTDYGVTDAYQQNTSFACDSYSVGLGGAANINKHLRLNAGYFWTMYSDYTQEHTDRTDVYSRTNGVLGVGIDYKF